MNLDLRTEREKQKEEIRNKIINDYIEIREASPEFSRHRVHCFLASRYGYTYQWIAHVLNCAGINN